MNCEEALLLISSHLDEMNTPEEEAALQAHLAHCGHCRQVLSSFQENDMKLADLRQSAPQDLCGNVMAQIRKETGKRTIRRWSGLAVAAALVLVIGISAFKPAGADHAPQMVSEAKTYTMSRTMPALDGEGLAQRIADERSAAVAVVNELYYEMESCPCETLAEGYLLYELPDRDTVQSLSETYGCAVYEAAEPVNVYYALLVP